MSRINRNHVGETLDQFLAECGVLEEVSAEGRRRALEYKLQHAIKAKPTNKTAIATKTKKKHDYRGGSFEDFLIEQGMLEEVDAKVSKWLVARDIKRAMKAQHINKAAMAKKIHTTKEEVDKLLNIENRSIDVNLAIRAADTLGIHHTLSS